MHLLEEAVEVTTEVGWILPWLFFQMILCLGLVTLLSGAPCSQHSELPFLRAPSRWTGARDCSKTVASKTQSILMYCTLHIHTILYHSNYITRQYAICHMSYSAVNTNTTYHIPYTTCHIRCTIYWIPYTIPSHIVRSMIYDIPYHSIDHCRRQTIPYHSPIPHR